MKLISCEIANFGKLFDEKISFDGGLAQFYGENGYGKTTLCAFLRAMFYGMETHREKDASFCDRERYFPFGGGRFGGALTFSQGEKICRVERFFDEKSATKDTFSYFENGERIERNRADFGREVLRMDEESFCRSLFFDSRSAEISATDGLRRKLGENAGGTPFNAAAATEILEKRRKEICGDRKNASSEISRLEAERAAIEREIDALRAKTNTLDGLYAERARLKRAVEEDERTIENFRKSETLAAKKEAYFHLAEQARDFRKKAAAINEKYRGGIFTRGEIDRVKRLIEEETRRIGAAEACAFPRAKEELLQKYVSAFPAGVPKAEQLDAVAGKIDRLGRLQASFAQDEEEFAENAAFSRFSGTAEEERDFARAAAVSDRYRRAQSDIAAAAEDIVSASSENSGKKKERKVGGFVLCALFGAALAFFGGYAAFLGYLAGWAVAVAGAGCIAFAAVLAKKTRSTKTEKSKRSNAGNGRADYDTPSGERGDLKTLHEEYAKSSAYLADFLTNLGYEVTDVSADFARASRDYAEYRAALSRRAIKERTRGAEEAERVEIERFLSSFFSAYRLINGDYLSRFRRLKNAAEKYADLSRQKAEGEARSRDAKKDAARYRAEAERVFSEKGIDVSAFSSVAEAAERAAADTAEHERCISYAEAYAKKAAEYRSAHDLSSAELSESHASSENAAQSSSAALSCALNEKRALCAATDRAIAEAESAELLLEEKERALSENGEKYADALRRLKIYRAAIETLRLADDSLLRRFVQPVRNRFIAYAELIEKQLGWEVSMRRDFSLTFSRGGAMRKDGHLSAGVRSVCAFCLRLALIDEIFDKKDPPFFILDDPFVHLDEANFLKTAALLKEISRERQLLYFTCHPSRKMPSIPLKE